MSEESRKMSGIRLPEGILGRIVSPVTLIFPNRSKKSYRNGEALATAVFERDYTVKSIAAVDDEIGIILEETED